MATQAIQVVLKEFHDQESYLIEQNLRRHKIIFSMEQCISQEGHILVLPCYEKYMENGMTLLSGLCTFSGDGI